MKFHLLLIPILFLVMEIHQIKMENKKLPQKSFNEIFGEKWEEKERNEQKKGEIIMKYYKIKEKIKEKGKKYSNREWDKMNSKIAKKLGTNRHKIYKWIKELGLHQKRIKTDEQKFKIMQKYDGMINEYKQKRKYSNNEWIQNYAEISKKIGANRGTIRKWKKTFGIRCKRITEEEKIEKLKIYWQIKGENPQKSDKEIAKMLKINGNSLLKWKKQFETIK